MNNYVRAPQAHPGGERCGTRGGPVAVGGLDLAALHPDSHLDQPMLQISTQDGVGDGLADGQDQVVDNLTRDGAGSCRKLAGR